MKGPVEVGVGLATVWVDFQAESHRFSAAGGAVIAIVSQILGGQSAGRAWRGTVGNDHHYWSNRLDARAWCDERLREGGWLLPDSENPATEELRLLRRLETSLDACLNELQTHHDALKAFRRRAPQALGIAGSRTGRGRGRRAGPTFPRPSA